MRAPQSLPGRIGRVTTIAVPQLELSAVGRGVVQPSDRSGWPDYQAALKVESCRRAANRTAESLSLRKLFNSVFDPLDQEGMKLASRSTYTFGAVTGAC